MTKQIKNVDLLEASRQQLLDKGKKSDNYKDTSKGKNRYQRRRYSNIARNVRQYNQLDMNTLFKFGTLNTNIEVKGETDTYNVKIRFDNLLREIEALVKQKGFVEFKDVLRAISYSFNKDSVWVSCQCADWQYRQAFFASKHGYNSGVPEMRPSDITNPHDTKGAGCKHVMLVLANVDWIMKVASVINNYIKYMEEKQPEKYKKLIYPKIFNKQYIEPEIATPEIEEPDIDLETDTDTIDQANILGRDRGKFTKQRRVNNQRNWKPLEPEVEEPATGPSLSELVDETENQ